MALINIEIAYALPQRYFLKKMAVEEGTMIQAAILQSGILQQFTEIDLRENKVGIFSRPVLADPKEIRRKRAEQQQKEAQLKKETEKALKKQQKEQADD